MKKKRPVLPAGQEGNILIIIMVMMMLAMLLASALIEHFAVTEAREVEASLARVRAYWAMSGHVDYVLSRTRQYVSACTDTTNPINSDFRTAFNGFNFDPASEPGVGACDNPCNDGNDNPAVTEPQIIRCFFEELENGGGDDVRRWNYGNGYDFLVQNDGDPVGGANQLRFVFSTNSTLPVLDNARVNTLRIRPNMNTTYGIDLTAHFRTPP